ncbi:MAG: hypothetical protein QOI82_2630 [Actinomycetota bacterium]|jgi:thioredoxin reductase|nr:hypothetical protein [Actinomycetota bacterium]
MDMYDVAIVGGGAAGLSAALVLARARRRVVVVDGGKPRNAPAAHLHGFLSRDGMPPHDLLLAGRAEVERYGAHVVGGVVTRIRRAPSGFDILVSDRPPLRARRLLVTTGLRDELPDVEGVAERWGRDLLHCPYCHGYEIRDLPLAVLGGSPEAVQHALLLRQWSSDVVLFSHEDEPSAEEREQLGARAVGVVQGRVRRLVVENDRLAGLELEDGRVFRRTAAFVRPRFVPNGDLLSDLSCSLNVGGWVTADAQGRTDQPGVWAAGNVVNPRAQVITAAGEGSAAAIAINADLVEEDVRTALHAFRSGLPSPRVTYDAARRSRAAAVPIRKH